MDAHVSQSKPPQDASIHPIPVTHTGYGGGEIQRYVIQFGVARGLLEERP